MHTIMIKMEDVSTRVVLLSAVSLFGLCVDKQARPLDSFSHVSCEPLLSLLGPALRSLSGNTNVRLQ